MKRIIAMFLSALTMFSLCAFPAYAIGQDAEQNAYETVVTISGEENIRRYLVKCSPSQGHFHLTHSGSIPAGYSPVVM